MMYQCGRCGLTRASGQEMGVITQCKCPWEFVPPVAPHRTWEGLSVFEINDLVENTEYEDYRDLVERTEAKLKEKNT